MQPLTLMPLPYPEDALAPVTSAPTLGFHHGAHHAGYVKKVNDIYGSELARYDSLEQLIMDSRRRARACSTTPGRSGTTTSSGSR